MICRTIFYFTTWRGSLPSGAASFQNELIIECICLDLLEWNGIVSPDIIVSWTEPPALPMDTSAMSSNLKTTEQKFKNRLISNAKNLISSNTKAAVHFILTLGFAWFETGFLLCVVNEDPRARWPNTPHLCVDNRTRVIGRKKKCISPDSVSFTRFIRSVKAHAVIISCNTYGDGKYACKVQWPLASQLDDGTFSAGFVMSRLHVASCHAKTVQ